MSLRSPLLPTIPHSAVRIQAEGRRASPCSGTLWAAPLRGALQRKVLPLAPCVVKTRLQSWHRQSWMVSQQFPESDHPE